MEKINSFLQVRKGAFEIAVLLLLRRSDMYGYQITSKLNETTSLQLAGGSIYPILKRLMKNDLVTSYWHESEGGPARKYYKMTEDGNRELESQLVFFKELYCSLMSLENEMKG